MIWVVVICVSITGLCVSTMALCLSRVIDSGAAHIISHDRCHEHAQSMLQMSTVRAEAQALRRAAAMWDSVEEQNDLRVLAREQYVEDGPSVPALWLRQQATKLDGKTHD